MQESALCRTEEEVAVATVTFDHVWKKFGEVVAVNDLNLEIHDGEFMVLVGPSGCGKTTSLRMIAGLEEISNGDLRIGDRVVNNVPPKDRDIAMVFQSYALYPHMTVRDNLAFGLKLRKTPKADIEKRVNEAAGLLSLEKLLDRKPRELSGGQRQRVALGRAIVREPAVFLMDEPLSNLDAKLRVETRANIARLHQRLKTTTVYVTHDQVEAMTMGQRIAVMSEARLQQVGSPQALYDHPNNRFVAGFIGSPSMNFLTVGVTRSGDDVTLSGPSINLPLPDEFKGRVSGSEVILGIRPEHLDMVATGPSGVLNGSADVVEYLGNEELIHVSASGQDIVAVIGSEHRVRPGDALQLQLALDKVHLFDPESGLSLSPNAEFPVGHGGLTEASRTPSPDASHAGRAHTGQSFGREELQPRGLLRHDHAGCRAGRCQVGGHAFERQLIADVPALDLREQPPDLEQVAIGLHRVDIRPQRLAQALDGRLEDLHQPAVCGALHGPVADGQGALGRQLGFTARETRPRREVVEQDGRLPFARRRAPSAGAAARRGSDASRRPPAAAPGHRPFPRPGRG